MRSGLATGLSVFGVMAMGLACGGASYDNEGACKRYVEAMNGMECASLEMDADQLCPTMLNMTPCDLASYYDCMAEAAKCDGDIPDLAGQRECGSPTCD